MADRIDDEPAESGEADAEATKKPSRGPLKMLGAVVGLVATGLVLALMALPDRERTQTLQGPAMHEFFGDGEIVGNPVDDNYSRYLKFKPSCSYFAYDLRYPELRRQDPHYETLLRETLQHTISRFRIDEVMAGADRDAFASELEAAAEPILFPVHVGETTRPYDMDASSGLRPGDSQDRRGTFRGFFYDHALTVDSAARTIQLDDGPPRSFTGSELDLEVADAGGATLYLDVTRLVEGFEGEVHVGVMGRIRRLFTGDIIAQ